MNKTKNMREVREIAELHMKLCVNCKHPGLLHIKKDHHDQSRRSKVIGELGECQKCKSDGKTCKYFTPSK